MTMKGKGRAGSIDSIPESVRDSESSPACVIISRCVNGLLETDRISFSAPKLGFFCGFVFFSETAAVQ